MASTSQNCQWCQYRPWARKHDYTYPDKIKWTKGQLDIAAITANTVFELKFCEDCYHRVFEMTRKYQPYVAEILANAKRDNAWASPLRGDADIPDRRNTRPRRLRAERRK